MMDQNFITNPDERPVKIDLAAQYEEFSKADKQSIEVITEADYVPSQSHK